MNCESEVDSALVRHNILFGSAMEEGKYEATLESCGLSADLRSMPGYDATQVRHYSVMSLYLDP